MSYQRKIGLRLLRAKHGFHRHWVAVRYALRLHRELESVRVPLIGRFGREWVQKHLPKLTHAHLAGSAWRLVRVASDPKIDREHRQRTVRWKACLRKLRDLPSANYPLTEPASRRVYHAALTRCLSELAGEPVSVPDWGGPIRGGLTLAIVRWLESVGIDQDPVVMATPLASSALDPLEAVSPTPAGAADPNASAGDEVWVAAVREQYEYAHEGSLQELHAAYLRCHLAHIALAEALVVTPEAVAA
ncbi:MAG: hypothetical protein EA381_19755 [Planctomycetaceae bacterium]|nr:MAG: hypothetical protein EA381_19755 [Planctomycetaceae bacterium]